MIAALVFAALYTTLFLPMLLVCTVALAWETLRWLLFSVLLVPALSAIGVWGLLPALPLIGLLSGAIAARWPDRLWLRLSAAILLPVVELALLRRSGLPHLAGRVLPLLMDHRARLLLDTVAPSLASGLSALSVPSALVRRVLGVQRRDR